MLIEDAILNPWDPLTLSYLNLVHNLVPCLLQAHVIIKVICYSVFKWTLPFGCSKSVTDAFKYATRTCHTFHTPPQDAIFYHLLVFNLRQAQMFSSTHYSYAVSIHIFPIEWEINFHTHEKQQGDYSYPLLDEWIGGMKTEDLKPNVPLMYTSLNLFLSVISICYSRSHFCETYYISEIVTCKVVLPRN
jgi:hypothetical protein